MMKKIFLLILLASCGSVVMLPNSNNNDLYNKNKSLLNEHRNQKFIEISAEEIKSYNFNEIYLFANWCPHCYSFLKTFKENPDKKIILVSTNYDIPYFTSHFPSIDTIYILSNAKYGEVESQKILSFTSELLGQDTALINGVPQRFKKINNKITRIKFSEP